MQLTYLNTLGQPYTLDYIGSLEDLEVIALAIGAKYYVIEPVGEA